jgi:predicted transcriptional regulator
MALKQQIIDLLNQKPGLDSNQIAAELTAKITSVKVTLVKLINAEKVTRIKEPHEDKKPGRKNIYRYKVRTD